MKFAQESVFSRMPTDQERITAYYDNMYAEDGCTAYPPDITRVVLRKLCAMVNLKPGARVLDVGCGTGYYTAFFHAFGYDVTGIDLSETGIRKAQELYPGIPFEIQDATALPYSEGSFDFVFAMGVSVANTRDLQKIHTWLEHLLTVTRAGGTVAFLGGSTLSGECEGDNEWINHRWKEILDFAPPAIRHRRGPWLTHFRLMKPLPSWLSMNPLTTQVLRFLPLTFSRRIVLLLRK